MSQAEQLLDLIKITNERIDVAVKMLKTVNERVTYLNELLITLNGDQKNETIFKPCPHGFPHVEWCHDCKYILVQAQASKPK